MGRHRRSAAGHAAGRATGATETSEGPQAYGSQGSPGPQRLTLPDQPTVPAARSSAPPGSLYDEPLHDEPLSDEPHPARSSHRRDRKPARPVRTGLLGVSAAMAIGAAAVATGVLPGGDTYDLGGNDDVRTMDSPSSSLQSEQGGTTGPAEEDSVSPTGRDGEGQASPSVSPTSSASASASKSSGATPSQQATKQATPTPTQTRTTAAPAPTPTASQSSSPVTVSAEEAAEAEVLRLVNEQRATVGCSPLSADPALAELAGDYSVKMADEGFFDHTDPEGKSPWDRAAAAGISNLGGENIARGQADAQAVMDAWMNSAGHRANILNCDFTTLGVGVHFGSGGPWWTQDFGY